MVQNIFSTESASDRRQKREYAFYFARVTSVSDDGRSVVVQQLGDGESSSGKPVTIDTHGDVNPAQPGDIAVVLRGAGDRETILGYVYQRGEVPDDWEAGDRRLGHPRNDSNMTIRRDGTIEFSSDSLLHNGEELGSEGASVSATYITLNDESEDLENSEQHSELSGDDLHDPANHGNEAHEEEHAVDGNEQPPESHASDHEDGGSDEITVDGLSGELADAQEPKKHGNEAHDDNFVTGEDSYNITVSDTEPSNPSKNDIWIDTS